LALLYTSEPIGSRGAGHYPIGSNHVLMVNDYEKHFGNQADLKKGDEKCFSNYMVNEEVMKMF
jgi:hypothetical protein